MLSLQALTSCCLSDDVILARMNDRGLSCGVRPTLSDSLKPAPLSRLNRAPHLPKTSRASVESGYPGGDPSISYTSLPRDSKWDWGGTRSYAHPATDWNKHRTPHKHMECARTHSTLPNRSVILAARMSLRYNRLSNREKNVRVLSLFERDVLKTIPPLQWRAAPQ